MAKFVMECPSCGRYVEALNGFFSKRHIDCICGYTIDVKTDKMTSRVCPHCGNNVVYDQSKSDKAVCPVCHEKINTVESMTNLVEFSCPSCSCKLSADKNAVTYTCPLCETEIDVQKQAKKENVKNQGLASVIKFEGSNDVFVWKHPIEDFNLGSQLIVHESQEAVFFRDGQALDLFGAGRYTLATQNLPALEKLYKLPTNTDEVFHSEIYFVNLVTQMGIKWGTDSKVRLFDPASGLHIEIGACGNFNLKVTNSRKLLLKVVGTAQGLSQGEIMGSNGYDTGYMVGKFKSLVINKVKSNLAKAIKEQNINILEIDGYIDILSESLKIIINETLDEYGLNMPEFFITTIMTPDDDPNYIRLKQQFADRTLKVRQEEILKAEAEAAQARKIVQAQTEAQLKMVSTQAEAEAYKMQAMAEAEEMRMKGYTYQQETARQVGVGAVNNMGNIGGGSGGLGDIAGLGVSLGAMGGVINMTKDALSPMTASAGELGANVSSVMQDTWNCSCGTTGISGRFCSNCGAKKPESATGWDCACGQKGITGNFCSNCGAKKPEPPETWDCVCGQKGITGNFCSNCGAKKPEPPETWDCSCGKTGIDGNFCPSCSKKKGE